MIESPSDQQILAANEKVTGSGMVIPAGANVLNVKAFGAMGDGVHDDTAAIQAAYNRTGLIYFPNGTYLVTSQIKAPPRKGSASSRRIIQGQSTQGVIIKLLDQCPGFEDAQQPRSVLVTSWGVAQAFRNSVRNVTIDVGANNPAAVGLEFFASNQGVVSDVVLRSPGPGHTGLLLKGDNGPLYVKNLTVEGFDTGINASANQSATMEGITLQRQNALGMLAGNKTFIRNLVSNNTVAALKASGQATSLLGAKLTGGQGGPAVIVTGMAFLRGLTTEGYDVAVEHKDQQISGPQITEWTSREPIALISDVKHSLNLPIQSVPQVDWDDPKHWVSVADYKPGTITIARAGTKPKQDWSPALQQAIDSGATTVYFPRGQEYELYSPIRVRRNVRRIIGCEVGIRSDTSAGKPAFIIEDGTAPTVVLERFDSMYGNVHVKHRSSRTLVIENMVLEEVDLAAGSGDLFVSDTCFAFLNIRGNRVWARQLDMEGSYTDAELPLPRPNVRNEGGTLWVLGMKTEQNRTKIWTAGGGRTEVYAYILANRASNPQPMFVSEASTVSLNVCESVLRNSPFDVILRVIDNQKVTDLRHNDAPKHGPGCSIPLVTAGGR